MKEFDSLREAFRTNRILQGIVSIRAAVFRATAESDLGCPMVDTGDLMIEKTELVTTGDIA